MPPSRVNSVRSRSVSNGYSRNHTVGISVKRPMASKSDSYSEENLLVCSSVLVAFGATLKKMQIESASPENNGSVPAASVVSEPTAKLVWTKPSLRSLDIYQSQSFAVTPGADGGTGFIS
jgi:hypothetical protein